MKFNKTTLKDKYIYADGDAVIPLSFLTIIIAILFCIFSFNGYTKSNVKEYKLESVTRYEKSYLMHKEYDGTEHYGDNTVYYKFVFTNGKIRYTKSIPANNNNGKYYVEEDKNIPKNTIIVEDISHTYFSPTKIFSSSIKHSATNYRYNN